MSFYTGYSLFPFYDNNLVYNVLKKERPIERNFIYGLGYCIDRSIMFRNEILSLIDKNLIKVSSDCEFVVSWEKSVNGALKDNVYYTEDEYNAALFSTVHRKRDLSITIQNQKKTKVIIIFEAKAPNKRVSDKEILHEIAEYTWMYNYEDIKKAEWVIGCSITSRRISRVQKEIHYVSITWQDILDIVHKLKNIDDCVNGLSSYYDIYNIRGLILQGKKSEG